MFFFKTTLNQTQYQKEKADASLIYWTYEWNANRSKLCIIDTRIIGGAQGKSDAVLNKTFSNSCRRSISNIIQSQSDNRRFHIRNINSIDFSYESRRCDRSKWEKHANRPLSVKTFRSLPTVRATRAAKNSRNLRIFILNRFSYRVLPLFAHFMQPFKGVNVSCACSQPPNRGNFNLLIDFRSPAFFTFFPRYPSLVYIQMNETRRLVLNALYTHVQLVSTLRVS